MGIFTKIIDTRRKKLYKRQRIGRSLLLSLPLSIGLSYGFTLGAFSNFAALFIGIELMLIGCILAKNIAIKTDPYIANIKSQRIFAFGFFLSLAICLVVAFSGPFVMQDTVKTFGTDTQADITSYQLTRTVGKQQVSTKYVDEGSHLFLNISYDNHQTKLEIDEVQAQKSIYQDMQQGENTIYVRYLKPLPWVVFARAQLITAQQNIDQDKQPRHPILIPSDPTSDQAKCFGEYLDANQGC